MNAKTNHEMKRYIHSAMLLLLTAGLAGCDDFFDPETDDSLDGDKYMSSLTEMSTGYLGVLTKMQEVGDKAILLTDTRGELLEPTNQSTNELIALYNYDDDLAGNPYADPAPYYDLVIACNDYIENMIEFKAKKPELVAETNYFEGLLGSAIRVKVWTYLTIAEIYGQVLWFDDPILKIEDLTDPSRFQLLTLDQTVDKCLDLLRNGYKGYAATENFSWVAWLDPSNVSSIASSQYRYWDTMTPPYEGLLAKCLLWKGAALDAQGLDSRDVYVEVVDVLLPPIEVQIINSSDHRYWIRTNYSKSHYATFWDYASPYPEEAIGAIIYDYQKNQTNSLLKHFSDEYPNQYLLRPSQVGRDRWLDNTFNPGTDAATDNRGSTTVRDHNDVPYIAKYRRVGSSARVDAFRDDVHIYTFRGGDYLMMICEALNNSCRFNAAAGFLNSGVNDFRDQIAYHDTATVANPDYDREWRGFSQWWTNTDPTGTNNKYYFIGMRGAFDMRDRPMKTGPADEAEAMAFRQFNDSLIANEILLEFAVEGKTYPALIRLAKRWNDPEIITSRIAPKYGARADEIADKIRNKNPKTGLPGYFVPWDLQMK